MNIPNLDVPRVVILGGGFAGLKLAQNLDSKVVQTVLLDTNNYHTFQPLLYQVATAGLEADSIAYPLRKILKNKERTHIRLANVESVDMQEKKVLTDIGSLSYDYLVIATGASTNFFNNKNISKNAMEMKSITDSLNLRSYILQNFEEALNEQDIEKRDSLMNFVIVGGGPTGVELAGALAELKKHVLPKDFPDLDIRRMQIHLMEASDRVLPTMSEKASEWSLKYLKSMDINVWTSTMVKDYDGHYVKTSGKSMFANTMIWAAGVKGNIPKGIDERYTNNGRIVVDDHCFIDHEKSVAAIGDVALLKTKEFPNGLPMLGSVAQQQGLYLAKALSRKSKKGLTKPFLYSDKGTMATVGRNKAVVDMGKFKFGGLFAWMTWLLVHLMLLVDFRNRLIVFSNWVWSYVNFDRGTRLIVRRYDKAKSDARNLSKAS